MGCANGHLPFRKEREGKWGVAMVKNKKYERPNPSISHPSPNQCVKQCGFILFFLFFTLFLFVYCYHLLTLSYNIKAWETSKCLPLQSYLLELPPNFYFFYSTCINNIIISTL